MRYLKIPSPCEVKPPPTPPTQGFEVKLQMTLHGEYGGAVVYPGDVLVIFDGRFVIMRPPRETSSMVRLNL